MNRDKVTRSTRETSKIRKHRPKKRKQHFNPKTAETNPTSFSASAKKIKNVENCSVPQDNLVEYRIINFVTVFMAIAALVKCKKCNGDVEFQTSSERGLGFKIVKMCKTCNPEYINSSPFIGHSYEINRRFIYVMRILGLSLEGCKKFCGLMDMPKFLYQNTYDIIIGNMSECVSKVTDKVFSIAVEEEKKGQRSNLQNENELSVSGDGTWKKCGFSSLFGVASLIGYYSGKIIDICVKSAYCKMCEVWRSKCNDFENEYQLWFETHEENCSSNHTGSSGKMEVDAVVEMFQRSEEKYGVKYRNYIGDGDSKTYSGILQRVDYGPDFLVSKKECVGHVQKRMGTRLRTLVKNTVKDVETKQKKVTKRKVLGGKGKLTGKLIDKLSVYYGLAIRRNCASIEKMRNAIWATFYHYGSTDEKPMHDKCPVGEDSWCEWQRAVATGKAQAFTHSYDPIPNDVLEAIRPIYEDLSKDDLLERCVGGFNQNNNESYNQLIWKITPKILASGATIVNIAANISACIFNEGAKSHLMILYSMGSTLGRNAHEYCSQADQKRISEAEHRAQLATKNARVLRRQQQKDILDTSAEAEDSLYGPGIDDTV